MARKPIKATEIDFDEVEESAPHRDPKRKALAKVAATFSAWKPAREVMTAVRAVPTIFPQYDRATRVGGHPFNASPWYTGSPTTARLWRMRHPSSDQMVGSPSGIWRLVIGSLEATGNRLRSPGCSLKGWCSSSA